MMLMLKKTALILALIILLAFSGCIEQPQDEEPDFLKVAEDEPYEFFPEDSGEERELNPVPFAGNVDAMETESGKDIARFNTAIEAADPGPCLDISELWIKNNCITAVARESQDTGVCDLMESAFGSDNSNVKYQCISDVALELFYGSDCLDFGGDRWEQACWGEVEAVCNKIPQINWRESCLKRAAIEAGSEEKCLELHDFERDICLAEVAYAYQYESICEKIVDETIRTDCLARMGIDFFET